MKESDQCQAPAALLPGKNAGTHLRRGCLDSKDGLYYTQNGKKSLAPLGTRTSNRTIPVPSHYTGCVTLAPVKLKISEAGLHKTRAASRHGD
jgi:hypothetical protein